jgi:hypothetical protein
MDQRAVNVAVALKRELAGSIGVAAAGGAGADQMRITDSPGLKVDYGNIQSAEHRTDLMRPMGRLGGGTVSGSYNAEVTLGGATDGLLEAIQRRIWTPPVVITGAEMGAGTFTTTANSIIASAGSWLVAGVRVGDIITPTTDVTTANNNLRLRVESVTASTITVAGTPLTANAVARALTITILKKVTTAGVPSHYSYTVEQDDLDIDLAELFLGCRLTAIALALRPNAISTLSYTFMGISRTKLTEIQTPYFTSPSLTVGVPLITDDGVIRAYNSDVAKFTALDLNIAIAAAGQPVLGSRLSPDIYDNDATITGSVSAIRQDFTHLNMLDNETEFELSATMIEPGSAPFGVLGLFMPRVKFASLEAPFRGGEGPKIETLNLMVAPRATLTGYDVSALNIFSSAA